MVASELSVAILTGGQSRRMGRDKAMLPWGAGVLLDHIISIAREVPRSSGTYVIGDRAEYHGRGAEVVQDSFHEGGPLGGIATALEAADSRRVLVLGVDMPLVSPSLLDAMVNYITKADILVPEIAVQKGADPPRLTLQVVHAIYGIRCLEFARERLRQNDRRVTSLFEDVAVERLDETWLRAYDPALRSFENANYPDDYERLRSIGR